MLQFTSLLFAAAAFSVAAVAASPLSQRDNERLGYSGTKAVYFQTNKSPNNVVAAKVESGGKI
jgi:hypothetical protein